MTLKNSQIENLYSYLRPIYQTKLDELETERINVIKESDECVTLFNKLTNFFEEVGLSKTPDSIYDTVFTILKVDIWNCAINSWRNYEKLNNKLRAILSTLSDNLSFEEIVKIVDEKLCFYAIIN